MAETWLPWVLGLAALVCVSAPGTTTAGSEIVGEPRVIAGDLFEIAGRRIRLFGVDAPDPDAMCAWPHKVFPCGVVARAAARDLVAGVAAVLCETRGEDREGVPAAVCYADGFDVGRNLVYTGWAFAKRSESLDYVSVEGEGQGCRPRVVEVRDRFSEDRRARTVAKTARGVLPGTGAAARRESPPCPHARCSQDVQTFSTKNTPFGSCLRLKV